MPVRLATTTISLAAARLATPRPASEDERSLLAVGASFSSARAPLRLNDVPLPVHCARPARPYLAALPLARCRGGPALGHELASALPPASVHRLPC